jgi:DNA replication protein DnaC
MQTIEEGIKSPPISPVISKKILERITEEGKKTVSNFSIKPLQEEYYINLYIYFSGSDKSKYDLNKGIMILGDVGTGKTLSMQIMQRLFRNFGIVNTRYIIRDFLNEQRSGTIIDLYGRESFKRRIGNSLDRNKPINWCFDDLGLENVEAKNYGNNIAVMEEILLDRYEMYCAYGMKTYGTTNLNVDMIEKSYGKRVRDRFRQMMNMVILSGESNRK